MSGQPLVDAFYDELAYQEATGRERQAVVILQAATEHAITSIRGGRPGYAQYQLERARLRAQRVLAGGVPAVVEIGGAR